MQLQRIKRGVGKKHGTKVLETMRKCNLLITLHCLSILMIFTNQQLLKGRLMVDSKLAMCMNR